MFIGYPYHFLAAHSMLLIARHYLFSLVRFCVSFGALVLNPLLRNSLNEILKVCLLEDHPI